MENEAIDKPKSRPVVIRDPAFAARFNKSLETSPRVPTQKHGRLTWVARELKNTYGISVSVETIRKWSIGEVAPRQGNLLALAKLLGVDEGWLGYGADPQGTPREKVTNARKASGLAHYVAGLMQLEGMNVAFPAEDDPVAEAFGVDLYAIVDGTQKRITIALGVDDGASMVARPRNAHQDNVLIIGVRSGPGVVALYNIPKEVIQSSVKPMGDYSELRFTLDGARLMTATHAVPQMRSVTGI